MTSLVATISRVRATFLYKTILIEMKKLLPLLLLLLTVSFCADAKKKQAAIKFNETSYSFGTIPEKGGRVSHSFTFTNTGDANLVIVNATADCGCTEPQYPAQPIAPGKTGTIKVTYDPLYRPGPFTKAITVRTNGHPKKTVLKINGTVK